MSKKRKSKKSPAKQTKPHFIETHWTKIIMALLLLIPLIYFSSFLSSDKMIAGSDYLQERYVLEKWTVEQVETPFWHPHIFGGMPVLGAPVGLQFFVFEQLRQIVAPHIVLVLKFITIFFLAGLGVFLYLREIGVSKYSAAIAAVIYQFIGNLATAPYAGVVARATSVALFPLVLFFIHRAFKSKRWFYFVLTGLTVACSFYEGQFQMTYYGLLFVLAYVIYYLIAHRKEYSRNDVVKVLGYGFCTVVLMCLLMAAIWLPVLGGLGTAARGVERGYEYAISWAMHPSEIIDLAIPTYSGILGNYWGFSSFKLHLEYFGLIALVFGIFTIILFWKKRFVKFFFFSGIIAMLIALGGSTFFFRIVYTIIPGFKLMRAPNLIFYLFSFSFIIMAAIGFDNIIISSPDEKTQPKLKKRLMIIGGIMVAVLLITAIVCITAQSSVVESMQSAFRPGLTAKWGPQAAAAKMQNIEKNFPSFISGIWRSIAFVVVILIMMFIALQKKVKVWIFAFIFMGIALVDQLPLMVKFLRSTSSPRVYYQADDVVNVLRSDKGIFRVFPTPWYEHSSDCYLLYHDIHSAGGYVPNPIQRYQEFIGAGTSVMFRPMNLLKYPRFLDMLNIKYIIGPTLPDDVSRYSVQDQRTISELKAYFSKFSLVFKGQQYSVYFNDSLLPRAYIVPQYRVVDQSEVLNIMESSEFDHRRIVILEEEPDVVLSNDDASYAPVAIEDYRANEITCTADNSYPGFLVFSDNWHPDWKVFIDGKEQKLYRANYTFRAAYVSEGKHEVVFKYISSYHNIGRIISVIAFILSVGLCIFIIARKKSS